MLTSRSIWIAGIALAVAAAGTPIYLAWVQRRAANSLAEAATPADTLRRRLVHEGVERAGDADLVSLYAQFNERHFAGELPPTPVVWEPRLGDVDDLEGGDAKLEGMFGTLGDRSVILLSPRLRSDRAALDRALAHEMVHAYMFRVGEDTAQHGPSFQAVLRRLAIEGAFRGAFATPEERVELRRWLDAEHDRLAVEERELKALESDLAAERRAIDALSSSDPHAFAARRDAYNRRAAEANDRLARAREDRAHWTREVERYNLMVLYPDGR
jgi:hypothetical protein